MATCSRGSSQANRSANKGDNEVKAGPVLRTPGIYVTTGEYPGNQLGDF